MASSAKHPRNAIGPAVRRFRAAYGWSQNELAEQCQLAGWDISRGIIAAIEGRVRWVGDFEAVVLAHVLKTSLVSLFPEKINWLEFKTYVTCAPGNLNR